MVHGSWFMVHAPQLSQGVDGKIDDDDDDDSHVRFCLDGSIIISTVHSQISRHDRHP